MAGTSLGALKSVAKRLGIPVEGLLAHQGNGEKWCYNCSTWKMQEQFGQDRARSDGRNPLCGVCCNTTSQKRRIHKGRRKGEGNPMWKGGRSVASNGYVLLRQSDHPLADVRGYVYEHRLVAEQMLGRPLRPEEEIHHKDGNKQNNDPSNLQVMPSSYHHHALHRKNNIALRNPGEPNPRLSCECGCGKEFAKYDSSGRPRKFISGHNGRKVNNGRDN